MSFFGATGGFMGAFCMCYSCDMVLYIRLARRTYFCILTTGSQQSNSSMYQCTMQLALNPFVFISGVLSGSTPPTGLSVTPIPNYVIEYG